MNCQKKSFKKFTSIVHKMNHLFTQKNLKHKNQLTDLELETIVQFLKLIETKKL